MITGFWEMRVVIDVFGGMFIEITGYHLSNHYLVSLKFRKDH